MLIGFLSLLSILLSVPPGQTLLTDPTFQAADALGYVVVGEIEFNRGSSRVDAKQLASNLEELGEMCPRTRAFRRQISNFAHFILIAWADSEYPPRTLKERPALAQQLAATRAHAVAQKLRKKISGTSSFELINMSTRQPHPIRVGEHARIHGRRFDVKNALEIAGAAPSDALGMGLFGEYSQRSKVIIWVDCQESFGPRYNELSITYQLALLGQI